MANKKDVKGEQPAEVEEEVVEGEILVEEATGSGYDGAAIDPRSSSFSSASSGAALAVRPAGRDVLMPLDSAAVIEGMQAYQKLLVDLLDPSDWQSTNDGRFPKKSAWRKIARAFNLSVTKISDRVERDSDGNPLRAEVVVRAIAPNGTVQDGDGYCAVEESRFKSSAGRAKLENDLRATAMTRAKNRAISDLVGMGEVSAEEVESGAEGGGGAAMPLATEEQKEELRQALVWFVPRELGKDIWGRIKQVAGGELYGPVAEAVVLTLKARKALDDLPAEKESPAKKKAREKREAKEAEEARKKQDAEATAPDPEAGESS